VASTMRQLCGEPSHARTDRMLCAGHQGNMSQLAQPALSSYRWVHQFSSKAERAGRKDRHERHRDEGRTF
jgi:hypothetical protein